MAELAVIGAGNMAEAIVRGAIRQRLYEPGDIIASDVRHERLQDLADELGLTVATNNTEAVAAAPRVLLAVKPQNLADVGAQLTPALTPSHTVLSVLAGKTIAGVRAALGGQPAVIRIMPNLPALIGRGAAGIAAADDCDDDAVQAAVRLFSTVGSVIRVQENQLDAVTAISGSGPGYVFLLMEAFVDAAMQLGLERQDAITLVLQTFLGASQLACDADDDIITLREKVSSPGGTTLAGLSVFEDDGLRTLVQRATRAAHDRARELGQQA